jgi:hypothetical protein
MPYGRKDKGNKEPQKGQKLLQNLLKDFEDSETYIKAFMKDNLAA